MEIGEKRKTYDRQFEDVAVNLIVNRGCTVEEVARELRISADFLQRWR